MAALLIGVLLLAMNARGHYSTSMNVPFFKNLQAGSVDPPVAAESVDLIRWRSSFFCGFLILVLVGASNAVNLTDGLDGLAIGLMIIAAGAMTVLSYLSGQRGTSRAIWNLSRTPGASELTIFCGAMTGASLGFLWYNAHPAEIFMGDVGSLALGGGLGTVAVLLKQEILLLFIGGVYVIECAVGDPAGGQLQAARQANFQNGAAASSLRSAGMAGIESHHAVLDRGTDDGAVRADHVEAADET